MREAATFPEAAAFPKVRPPALRLNEIERRLFGFVHRVVNWIRRDLFRTALWVREVRAEQLALQFPEPRY